MYVYKDNVFLENREESENFKKLLLETMGRNLALNLPVDGYNYNYNNICYDELNKTFNFIYNNKCFRDLHYGESRVFYVPDWANTVVNLSKQERYVEIKDNFKLPRKKIVASETSGELIEGYYKYTKQDKGIGRLDGLNFTLDSTEKMYYFEEMLDTQTVLDVNKIVFKFSLNDYTNERAEKTMFWTIMQRESWQNFKVDAYTSIIDIDRLLSSSAFHISSSHYDWIAKAPMTNIYINRSLKGKKDCISHMSILKYVPRSLTMEESFDYIDSIMKNKTFWYIDEKNVEGKYIILKNKFNVKIKLVFL